jgi:hypothetical protein
MKGNIRVVQSDVPGGVRLTLIATAGTRINARLKPALELVDETVLRFDTPAVTPDSAYFTSPPELLLPDGVPAEGSIRASVCDAGESVCRLVTLEVS